MTMMISAEKRFIGKGYLQAGVGEASAVSHGSTGLVGYIVPLTGESCSGVRSGWTSEPSWNPKDHAGGEHELEWRSSLEV